MFAAAAIAAISAAFYGGFASCRKHGAAVTPFRRLPAMRAKHGLVVFFYKLFKIFIAMSACIL